MPEVLVVLSVPVTIAIMAVTFVVTVGLTAEARPMPAEQAPGKQEG